MSNVKLIEKRSPINGISVADLLHLYKYNAKGLPEWVITAHNGGTIIIDHHTVTLLSPDGKYIVDFRWWIIEKESGTLHAIREDTLWDKYDKAEEQ